MGFLKLCWLLVNKIFATGLLIAVTVPHESEKRYIEKLATKNPPRKLGGFFYC